MADDFPIESRFALEERVGRGASGDVHRATDRQTGRTVAVKRLLPIHEDPLAVDRFRREARLLAQLDDDHVVRYVAHGIDATGRPCLVVEWLEGEDVAHRQRRERLTIPEAIEVVRQAAVGLHALHRAGIVHRDVKPANMYLLAGGDDGRALHVKLIDLGIARAAGESTLTSMGVALGTPFYMSPEQARGEERVTARADQFSLGVVLFELVAGRRPFTGDDFFAVLAKIVLQDPPRLRDVMAGVPPELDALVLRAMSKAPEKRFGSALEIADALAALPAWSSAGAASAPAPADRSHEATVSRVTTGMSATFEQRVVTAVFAGFAPSPDDAPLRVFAAVAEEHGAVCYPMLGRRMIGIFGGARTTGQEVVRAARAALAAAERVPEIQLAIATGRALAGVTGLSGDLIERAARDVERDEPYAVRIDDATARLLEEHFVIEGGERQRVLVGVRHATAGPPLTVGGKTTPCVGRDRELTNLEAAFAECAAEPVARAVIVTGPAGIGKSRVRHEFLTRITGPRHDPRPEVILARGSPLAETSAFGLLAPALRRLAGILDGEPAAEQRRKLTARLGRHASAAVVDRLGELASVPLSDDTRAPASDARAQKDAMLTGDLMRAAWIEWLEAECAVQPVVLVLEDLHWGDQASVSFVDAALRALPERPLLVVVLARPEVHDRFPGLFAERGAQELRLGPLTPKATERLVRAALGTSVDAAMVERIVGRAEGNAFYAEELIRAVGEGAGDALPDTVLGMVQARLDALGAEPKRVLRAASVFGQTFWRGGVAALLGEGGAGHQGLTEALDRLCAGEAVSRRASASFPGEEEYVFRHALVREAAYAMITDADRPVAHRLAGGWLEHAGEVDPAILAAHFARGGELERSARFHRRAAEKALGGNDFAGAILHAEGCVACGARDEERGRARLIQAEAHRWRGELGPAAIAGAEAAELLPRGTALWFHAVRETIAANGRLGHFNLVSLWGDEAIGCEAAPDAAGARLAALAPAAGQLIYAGEMEAAERLLAHIDLLVAGARDIDPRVSARVSQIHALRADHDRDLEGARAHQQAALASFERAGDRRGACLTLANLGYLNAALGDLVEAEDALRRAHASAVRMGLSTIAPLALHNLGGVLASLGRLDEARTVEEEAVRAFERAGDPRLEGASRVYLARILLAAGDAAWAEAESRLVAEAVASPAPLRAGALAALSQTLLAVGRVPEALAAATEAAAALASLGAVEDFEALIGVAHAEALSAAGEPEAAVAAITDACDRLLARAARLHEPTRTRFLEVVPDNARCFALARAWGVETG
jgi:tetratricopeptide (TPR) repeat protein